MLPKWTGIVLIALTAGSAAAVKPKQWTQKTEADFAKAELDATVVTNYGRIELSRATETRSKLPEDQTVIHDIAPLGKAFYLAVGPRGWLVKADADGRNARVVQQYKGRQVFALAAGKRGLWVAVSGEKKTQLELRGTDDAVIKTIDVPGVRYIWDMQIAGKTAYLATGTDGKVLAVALDKNKPKPRVLLDCEQDNVLCLGIDGQGRLYAGTDGEGLVYRLTPPKKGAGDWSIYVLYDANEPEIVLRVLEDARLDPAVIRDKVHLVKGFFDQTLRTYERPIALLHLDCDLYQSYMDALRWLYDRVVPGGLILFDEYEDPAFPGGRKAIDEFLATKPEQVQSHPVGKSYIVKQNAAAVAESPAPADVAA